MTSTKNIFISGRVIRGQRYGRVLGFRTANLERRQWARLRRKPKLGVWAGWVAEVGYKAKIQNWPAAVVVGPLDSRGLPKLEAHLIGFQGNLYGKRLVICLCRYLRPFRRYSSEAALRRQIQADIRRARAQV
ncbi:MAG: riboflavin kinase [Patescibacteria group bacterium]|nr:riboflavin kinase [Patescibacteria group bacterium]